MRQSLGSRTYLDYTASTALPSAIARKLSTTPVIAIQALVFIGPVVWRVFVAEIGDVTRFPTPDRLCSWAGLTPKHRQSDLKVHRGSISKQGSRLLRWAAVEAASKNHAGGDFKDAYRRIAARRGRNIAKVAAARRLLTLVYYGLRDGEIRCLAQARRG